MIEIGIAFLFGAFAFFAFMAERWVQKKEAEAMRSDVKRRQRARL